MLARVYRGCAAGLPLLALSLATWFGSARAPAQDAAAEPPPQGSFAVRCGRLLVGDGATELRDAWLVVRDGKVASIGREAPPPELPVVDASGRVVMPGIVAVDTDLGTPRDDEYAVTPDVLAIDGFDFEELLLDALEGGVTTAYVSPGRERLVSGQGAVVKTFGPDLFERVLDENQCLRVNFGDGGVQAPRVFEPGVHPTDDDPLQPARVQTPTARISVLAELRRLLRESAAGAAPSATEASLDAGYDGAALLLAAQGTLPIRAAAWQAADIRRALLLQREAGLRMVLENPQEIGLLADDAAAQQVACVFRMPVRLGHGNPGGEDRAADEPEPHFDAPARASAAGMPIGIAPGADVPLRDYLIAVALAVRHGLPEAAALRAVGADASRILGVDARVGTLEPGKDADFVVLSGPPLAIGTMVESTWVDGRRAFQRRADQQLLAVRCGKILDGRGTVYRSGVLLVQGNRIKAVGEDLSVPYGARLIDLPGAVMTPGFVDAFSHLGLAGRGTGVPNGAPGQLLDQAIAHDDPMFAPALRAGVTTVLASGKDGGLLAGRVSAIKTGAADHDSMIVQRVCGQRAVFDAIGPDSDKPLRAAVDRGKKYAEKWAAYEKALAAWKAGDKPAPAPAPAEPQPPAQPGADPVSGTWEAEIDVQGRFKIRVVMNLQLAGTTVTGSVQMTLGQRELPAQDVENGTFEGGRLHFEFGAMGQTATVDGTVTDDVFDGTVELGPMGQQPVRATRVSKEPGAAPAARSTTKKRGEDGEPVRPDVDEDLEPLRAVFEQRAALVVRVRRGAAIRAVVTLLQEEKVPFVLHDPEGVLDDASVLGDARPPILLEPEVVHRDGPDLQNEAADYADLDLPVLFGTGDCKGARFLPLHAAYAVRYGLSPDAALAAVTSNAARAFRLDERIGSLQRGRDADFVVFSGDPFEPTSRVLLVGCNGRIAVDNREVEK